MFVTRAPVRIYLAGDGAAQPPTGEHGSGLVISAAINRYVHARAARPQDDGVRLASTNLNARASYRRDQRPAVSGRLAYLAAVVEHFWDASIREQGIDLSVRCDVEPGGGMGASSAVLVALVGAVAEYCGQQLSAAETAELAARLEIERLRRPGGKQDHYASAFGGLNAISFDGDAVQVERLSVPPPGVPELSRWLMLLSTAATRDPADVLAAQAEAARSDGPAQSSAAELAGLAYQMRAELEQGNLQAFGRLLDTGWRVRRGSPEGGAASLIDEAYATARACGALGGKLCGSGPDGHLLLCCPPEARRYLRGIMGRFGLQELNFAIDAAGARSVEDASRVGRPAPSRSPLRRP